MTKADFKPRWRGMDAAARALAYSPSKALPGGDLDPFIQAYSDKSAAVYRDHPWVQCLRYGPKDSNTIDLFMPHTDAPKALHVFVHGGYWQALSKRDSSFPAPGFLARGVGFAAVDYTLAPEAGLSDIVAECLAALTHIFERAETLGVDPARISISGSSAGAHLVAMTCLDLPRRYRPTAVILLSGIYELEPLVGTYIAEPLDLGVIEARKNSPALRDLKGFPPALLAWGEIETDEFKRQSQSLAAVLPHAETLEVQGRNHFDIVHDLSNDSALAKRVAMLCQTKE